MSENLIVFMDKSLTSLYTASESNITSIIYEDNTLDKGYLVGFENENEIDNIDEFVEDFKRLQNEILVSYNESEEFSYNSNICIISDTRKSLAAWSINDNIKTAIKDIIKHNDKSIIDIDIIVHKKYFNFFNTITNKFYSSKYLKNINIIYSDLDFFNDKVIIKKHTCFVGSFLYYLEQTKNIYNDMKKLSCAFGYKLFGPELVN